jgi:hypothetical protein
MKNFINLGLSLLVMFSVLGLICQPTREGDMYILIVTMFLSSALFLLINKNLRS